MEQKKPKPIKSMRVTTDTSASGVRMAAREKPYIVPGDLSEKDARTLVKLKRAVDTTDEKPKKELEKK